MRGDDEVEGPAGGGALDLGHPEASGGERPLDGGGVGAFGEGDDHGYFLLRAVASATLSRAVRAREGGSTDRLRMASRQSRPASARQSSVTPALAMVRDAGGEVGIERGLLGAAEVFEERSEVGIALDGEDERVGHLALAQVGEEGLARGRGIAGKVEQVVDELEGHAELLAVGLEGAGDAALHAAGAGAGEHGPAEERGRLAVDDAKVIGRAAVHLAAPGELQALGDHHLLEHLEHALEHLGVAGGLDAAERVDEQPVAAEDRRRVAVDDARGGRAPAEIAHVDHVVVQERRVVDELDGHRVDAGLRGEAGAGAGGERHADGAEALPVLIEQVPRGLVRGLVAGAGAAERALDLGEIALQPGAQLDEPAGERVEAAPRADALEVGEDVFVGVSYVGERGGHDGALSGAPERRAHRSRAWPGGALPGDLFS